MHWVRRITLWVGLLLIVAIAAAYMLPRNVHVERSATIAAPRATVFTLLNSYKQFNRWSPWFELDPEARYTYEGPGAGVGAKLSWVGNEQTLGSGSQVITASEPYEKVAADVDFGQGGGPAKQVYTLTAEGAGTKVSWSMDVDLGMNPIGRYFGLGFEGMIGKDFDRGLALLKTFAEGLPKADFAGLDIEAASVEPITVAYVPTSSAKNDGAIAAAIGAAYGEVGAFMKAQMLKQAGAPITIDTGSSDTGYLFDAAIPVDGQPARPVPPESRVRLKQTYGGKVLKVALRGSYSQIPATYDKIVAYIAAHGIETNGNPWDEFANDPTTVKESDVLTNIYFPIK
jgi:effector-binding domain-containing protein/carbon monoxide dehydrogenase subunit G